MQLLQCLYWRRRGSDGHSVLHLFAKSLVLSLTRPCGICVEQICTESFRLPWKCHFTKTPYLIVNLSPTRFHLINWQHLSYTLRIGLPKIWILCRVEFVRPYVCVANGAHTIAGCLNWLLWTSSRSFCWLGVTGPPFCRKEHQCALCNQPHQWHSITFHF